MRREWQWALLVSGLCALPFAIFSWFRLFEPGAGWTTPTGNYFGLDFVNFWSAGRLVLLGWVDKGYDPATYKALLAQWFAAVEFTNLSYPPSLLPLVTPFALLPYFAAYAIWQVLGVAAFFWACLGRLPRRADGLLLPALILAPVLISNLVFGQIALFMCALFVGALRVMPGRPMLAGVLFGIMTVKPQIGVLVPVFLLATGAWRTIAAACVTALVLFAVSVLSFGLEPWKAYLTTTAQMQWSYILAMKGFYAYHMTTPYAAFWSLGAPVQSALAGQWIVTAAVVLITAVTARSKAPGPLKAAILTSGTVLAIPYSLAHDLAIPLAALVWYLSTLEKKPNWASLIAAGGLWLMPFPLSFLAQLVGAPVTQVFLALVYVMLVAEALGVKSEFAHAQPLPRAG